MEQLAIKLLGFAAATCTTLAYAPQFVKVWRTRSTEDISPGMFLVMVLGAVVWPAFRRCAADRRECVYDRAGRRDPLDEAEVRLKRSRQAKRRQVAPPRLKFSNMNM